LPSMQPLVDCPHCRRQTASDFKQCVHCGQGLPDELVNPTPRPQRSTPVQCPMCGSPSELVRLWGIQVDLCTACRGVWFDETEIADLAARITDDALAKDSEAALAKLDVPPTQERRAAYIRCPICAKQLAQRNYDRNAQLSVHRCHGCGTFIERAQLMELLWFLAAHRSNVAGEVAIDTKPVPNTYRPPTKDPQTAHYLRMHAGIDPLFDPSPRGREKVCFGDPLRPPVLDGTDAAFAAVSILVDLLTG
jgi:Zn-finger nucleic acid-binding protein